MNWIYVEIEEKDRIQELQDQFLNRLSNGISQKYVPERDPHITIHPGYHNCNGVRGKEIQRHDVNITSRRIVPNVERPKVIALDCYSAQLKSIKNDIIRKIPEEKKIKEPKPLHITLMTPKDDEQRMKWNFQKDTVMKINKIISDLNFPNKVTAKELVYESSG